jgi:hypothetical protein
LAENKIGSNIEADVASVMTKRLDEIKSKDATVIRAIVDESYNNPTTGLHWFRNRTEYNSEKSLNNQLLS